MRDITVSVVALTIPSDSTWSFYEDDSVRFHEQLGYKKVAHFHLCGKKFGRWYDMIWMEKIIGDHK